MASENARDRVIVAALSVAAQKPWREVSFLDIAKAAGLDLADVYRAFPSKSLVVAGIIEWVTRNALAGIDPVAVDTPRDRLFDMLMRRFDVLQPHRLGIAALLRDAPFDPLGAVLAAVPLGNGFSWMLEASGISASGPLGFLRANGALAIYVYAFRTWLRDDTEDMARTMATLDRGLAQAESLVRRLPPLGGRAADESASTASTVPDESVDSPALH